jgi:hypothetical protein
MDGARSSMSDKYTWGYRMKEENKIKLTSKQIDYLANFFEEDLHNLCPYVIDYRQLVEDGINTYNSKLKLQIFSRRFE